MIEVSYLRKRSTQKENANYFNCPTSKLTQKPSVMPHTQSISQIECQVREDKKTINLLNCMHWSHGWINSTWHCNRLSSDIQSRWIRDPAITILPPHVNLHTCELHNTVPNDTRTKIANVIFNNTNTATQNSMLLQNFGLSARNCLQYYFVSLFIYLLLLLLLLISAFVQPAYSPRFNQARVILAGCLSWCNQQLTLVSAAIKLESIQGKSIILTS